MPYKCSIEAENRMTDQASEGSQSDGRDSEDLPISKPPRRIRYSGKNPRHFHEKYKERQPDRYAADVAKVLAGGKTPAGMHRPIMVREILDILAPRPGEIAVDCTLGYGGHSRELLTAVQPGGRLLAVDADPVELPKTDARLRTLGFPAESLVTRRLNFAGIASFIAAEAPEGADLLLADLGVSSMQIDDPDRGFSFKTQGPLDMRMNPERGLSAAEMLSRLTEERLSRLLAENADEPHAELLAEAILRAHRRTPLRMTQDLAELIRTTLDRGRRSVPEDPESSVQRVFQALRIAVNDELGSLQELLRTLPYCLRPGGRVAFLTFHSGEDRRVKLAFKQGLQAGIYSKIATEPLRPSSEERRDNPRSSSAKLRFAVRAG